MLAALPAIAATGTWSGTAGATWDTTTTNWLNLSGTPWDLTNGGTNAAVFNTAAATPTVSGTVWVNAITFANTATISGGVINLAGTAPTITTTANGTISSLLAGSSGLTKAGASTLTLTGSNTYTGTTSVTGGGLTLGGAAGSILGSSAVNVSAATLTLDNSSNNLNDRIADTATVTLNAVSALAFTGNGATASTTEALGTLSLGGGQSTITLGGAGAGQLQTLSATSFSRSAGAVALVRGTNLQT
ncbi:MAG: hypothetical protein EBR28_14470, partial [Planctomycetia bacterium]|nr:hypothetical protein [Planctomycetia bacterium]